MWKPDIPLPIEGLQMVHQIALFHRILLKD
jgi:hypothetical protein